MQALPRAMAGLLAPSSTGVDAYPLVLCTGLDEAVSNLRSLELTAHDVGLASIEAQCVHINPCTQQSQQDNDFHAVPVNTWTHGNSSALKLPTPPVTAQAHNYGSFEYARVPEGLRLDTCAPDFDLWRRTGQVVCNEHTLRTFSADRSVASCPGPVPFSLLDCMLSIQHDATTQELVVHYGAMHFGTQAWSDVCPDLLTTANSSTDLLSSAALGAQMCRDTAVYSNHMPVAADIGSTSLLRYSFLPGYACHSVSDLATSTDNTEILSRRIAPNRKIACPVEDHGTYTHTTDGLRCQLTCDAGYSETADGCVIACALNTLGEKRQLATSCSVGFQSVLQCMLDDVMHYECQECTHTPGKATVAWTAASGDTCQYQACSPGYVSQDHACVPCGVNTYYHAEGGSQCIACDTLATGLYQTKTGQSACSACLGHAGNATECAPGHEFVQNFSRMSSLFDMYSTAGIHVELQEYYPAYCTAGFACMPCEAGTHEKDRICRSCGFGTYNPNYAATSCFECAQGQNTSHSGSTHSTQCVCSPGHE